MLKAEIAQKICEHLKISAPSLEKATKPDLEAIAEALGLSAQEPVPKAQVRASGSQIARTNYDEVYKDGEYMF